MWKRQRVSFQLGCYASLVTAGLHMVGHLQGNPPPANEAEETLFTLMRTYAFDIAGTRLTFETLFAGFSLTFSVFLVWLAATGLFIVRNAAPRLVRGVARGNAVFLAVLVGVSVLHFPLPPTVCLALILACFASASWGGVPSPAEVTGP
jgi:hypothetical protein